MLNYFTSSQKKYTDIQYQFPLSINITQMDYKNKYEYDKMTIVNYSGDGKPTVIIDGHHFFIPTHIVIESNQLTIFHLNVANSSQHLAISIPLSTTAPINSSIDDLIRGNDTNLILTPLVADNKNLNVDIIKKSELMTIIQIKEPMGISYPMIPITHSDELPVKSTMGIMKKCKSKELEGFSSGDETSKVQIGEDDELECQVSDEVGEDADVVNLYPMAAKDKMTAFYGMMNGFVSLIIFVVVFVISYSIFVFINLQYSTSFVVSCVVVWIIIVLLFTILIGLKYGKSLLTALIYITMITFATTCAAILKIMFSNVSTPSIGTTNIAFN